MEQQIEHPRQEREEKEDALNLKCEIFCQVWVDELGNGTQAALEAFDITNKELCEIDWKDLTPENILKRKSAENTAAVMAREYLRKPKIIKRIDEIMEERGLNEESVKREHFKLIKQDNDLSVKRSAISDYYKLKGKFVEHVDVTTKGDKIGDLELTDDQKKRIAEETLHYAKKQFDNRTISDSEQQGTPDSVLSDDGQALSSELAPSSVSGSVGAGGEGADQAFNRPDAPAPREESAQ